MLADCQKGVVKLDKLGKEKLSHCLFDPAAASNVNKKLFILVTRGFPKALGTSAPLKTCATDASFS